MVIKTLTKSLREYKTPSILSAVFVACEVVCECVLTYIMAILVNRIQQGCEYTEILLYGLGLIALSMLSLFFGVRSAKCAATASCGLAKNLRKDIFTAVQGFSFSDVDKFSESSLVTRLTTDVTNVQMAFGMIIRLAVRSPLLMVIGFAFSFAINVQMALILLCIMPFLAIILGIILFKAIPMFNRIFKKYDALNESVQENVSGIRVVKSYVREEYEKTKFERAAEDVRASFTKAEKLVSINSPVMMFFMYLAMLLIMAVGSYLIVTSASNGGTPVMMAGDLTSLITYGVQILSSLMMLSMVFVMITMAVESSKRITEVLTTKSTLTSKENAEKEVKDGSISFKSVNFKYSKKAHKNALENINIDIRSGETVGIIGGTGSAKTSLIQLIPRLYDATEGEVCVGGVNVKDYDLDALRKQVAVVLQKNILFSGTIKENMRWGNKDATDEEIQQACVLAQADSFIQGFPDKYDTHIEQGGSNVSGGQKQRLCIARAILRRPKVLILDDSTSAVDTKTDALIRNAFIKEIPGTTKIIIAQRITSVQDADKIIVMEGGKIDGIGTHEELLKNNAIYREVYESQTRTRGKAEELTEGADNE